MTVEEFTVLCEREWDNGHGDVDRLWITKGSWEELEKSMILAGDGEWFNKMYSSPEFAERLVNPITKTPVWIRPASDRDAAEVALPGGGGKTVLL